MKAEDNSNSDDEQEEGGSEGSKLKGKTSSIDRKGRIHVVRKAAVTGSRTQVFVVSIESPSYSAFPPLRCSPHVSEESLPGNSPEQPARRNVKSKQRAGSKKKKRIAPER